MLNSSEAAYRKPPFNGSIFGKRNSVGKYLLWFWNQLSNYQIINSQIFKLVFFLTSRLEYDNAKAVTAMCEIAMEACQSWFPQPESK